MNDKTLEINGAMPDFADLPGIDGKSYSSGDFRNKEILIIAFSCNHCPYVQAYEERMISLQEDYSSRGVQLIAINSNDTKNYPDDKFEDMVKRGKKKGFNFLYLRDEDQSVAGAFGATHTPEFFVFSRAPLPGNTSAPGWTLRYIGKMDDNWKNPQDVKEHYLRDALDAILSGLEVKVPKTFSIGCTIKWK